MNKIRKFFLKQLVLLIILILIASIWHIAPQWKIYLWIWVLAILPLILIPVLGRPIYSLWNLYCKYTSEGMRFFQGFGLVLFLVGAYLLRYHVYVPSETGYWEYLKGLQIGAMPDGNYLRWLWAAGALLICGSIPFVANHLFKAWMFLASLIQAVTSRVILFLVYLLAVLPVGLMAKLVGKKFMDKSFQDKSRESYWLDREHTFDPKTYYRHF